MKPSYLSNVIQWALLWAALLAAPVAGKTLHHKVLRSPKDQGNQSRRLFRLPPLPVVTKRPIAAPMAVTQPPPPPIRTAEYRYPANASNYVWDVQVSTDLVHWVTARTNCVWPPSTNGDLSTSPTNLSQFYRMFGHQ